MRLAIRRATNRPASMSAMNTPNTETEGPMKTTQDPETSLSARKISAIFDGSLSDGSAGFGVAWVQISLNYPKPVKICLSWLSSGFLLVDLGMDLLFKEFNGTLCGVAL